MYIWLLNNNLESYNICKLLLKHSKHIKLALSVRLALRICKLGLERKYKTKLNILYISLNYFLQYSMITTMDFNI